MATCLAMYGKEWFLIGYSIPSKVEIPKQVMSYHSQTRCPDSALGSLLQDPRCDKYSPCFLLILSSLEILINTARVYQSVPGVGTINMKASG